MANGLSHFSFFAKASLLDGITAKAGGGQANATPLYTQISRITTVATAGDSVLLPPSVVGAEVTVVNAGANAMQVYGSGTDTINGIAAATGISQLPNSLLTFTCVAQGQWHCEAVGSGYSSQFPTVSTTNSITAKAGGGQGSATALTTVINRVTTVGTAGDSVVLPPSAPGMQLVVINAAAANSMNCFPATGEAINALSANTAFAIAAGKTATFYCSNAGQWHALLTA